MMTKTLVKTLALTCVLCFGGLVSPLYAQETQNAEDVVSAPDAKKQAAALALEEKLSEEELARKVKLVEEMHRINPVKGQVDSAVMRVAKSLPEAQRKVFLSAMNSTLNYRAIERISVDAMTETYTLKELEAMVEYYSKPEARSASEKITQWAGKVQPEIVRMIDKAMIHARTGQ